MWVRSNGDFFRYDFKCILLRWILDDFNSIGVVFGGSFNWGWCHWSNLHPCFLSHPHSPRINILPRLIHLNLRNRFRNILFSIIPPSILLSPLLLLILLRRRKSSIPTLLLLKLKLILPLKKPFPLNLFT